MRGLKFLVLMLSFSHNAYASGTDIHTAYLCNDFAVGQGTAGNAQYDSNGQPINCSCSDASSSTAAGFGPGTFCNVTTDSPGNTGTFEDSNGSTGLCSCESIYGKTASGYSTLTASDCVAGEIFNSYGCIPAASCSNDPLPPAAYLISSGVTGGTQSQTFQVGYFITGDVFIAQIATTSQAFSAGPGDTGAMIAARIASYYNGRLLNAYTCPGSNNATATSSGANVTINHNVCHGAWGLSSARTSPSCPATPTPSPTPTPGPIVFSPTHYEFGSVGVNGQGPIQNVAITNTTGLDLTNCTVSGSDTINFILGDTSGCSTLPNAGTCIATLAGRPTGSGQFSDTLSVTCIANAPVTPTPTIPPTTPTPAPTPFPLAAVYRFHSAGDHLLTLNYSEGITAGFSYDGVGFYLASTSVAGTTSLNRCRTGAGGHFVSTSANCEGNANEGSLGYIFTSSVANTMPLYRFLKIGDHFSSSNFSEGSGAGMTFEFTQGYVPTN